MSKSKKPAAKPVPKSKTVAKPAAVLADADNNGAGAKLLNLIEEAVSTVVAVNAAESAPAAKKSRSKAKAAEPVPVVSQNNIKRPAADSLCGKVWAALDQLKADGKEPTAKNAAPAFDGVAIAAATIRTQTQRWKAFNSIKPAAAKQAAPAVVSEEAQQAS